MLAGFAARGALEGWPADEVRGWADRLRYRTIATYRARAGYTDKPVLGTVAVGLGAWMLHHLGTDERGLELIAVGERLSGRQDDRPEPQPADRGRRDPVDPERLAAARAEAAARPTDECAERARELIAAPVPSFHRP